MAFVYLLSPSKSSGGRYHLVTTQAVKGCLLSTNGLANPKSAILRFPRLSIRIFAPIFYSCLRKQKKRLNSNTTD